MQACGICGRAVDDGDIERRDSGDFHRHCFEGLSTAGIAVSNSKRPHAECRMCSRPIARGAPIVELVGLEAVTHLGCFFGTAARGRSVGACAGRLPPPARARALRAQSDALRSLSRRLLPRPGAGWSRVSV
jgi:hypothetical protein